MKDLDFDELDRAVNSLMTNVPKTAPQQDDAKEKTLDIAPTLDADSTPSFDKIEEAAAKINSDTPEVAALPSNPRTPPPVPSSPRPQAATTAPATRRSGRFMDVVHPSTDMKKSDMPRPISRQGVSLEPVGASQKIADIVPQKKETPAATAESKPEENPVVPMSKEIIEQPETEAPKESMSTSDWPDPLEMAAAAETKEPDAEVDEAEKPETEMPEPKEAAPAPLTSPFLPDAKVEKRPLGGMASEEEPEVEEEISRAPMADDTDKTVDDPNKQLPATPGELERVLPEELSGDLMAVEADTTHSALKQAHDEGESGSDLVLASEKEETVPEVKPEVKEDKPEPKPVVEVEDKPVPTGPTSIPQQYKEEPNTGDQDNGSIYDTDTYHQPLAHPAKKKSGWMWVIWIVLILLVGAGGGALLYSLGLV